MLEHEDRAAVSQPREPALDPYEACLATVDDPDVSRDISHGLYLTLRLLGRDAEAVKLLEPIHADRGVREDNAPSRRGHLRKSSAP